MFANDVISLFLLKLAADSTFESIRLQIYQATDLRLLYDARQFAKVISWILIEKG